MFLDCGADLCQSSDEWIHRVDNPDLRQNEISITLLSDVGGHLGCMRENLKSTVLLKKGS